jgi:hypothetical protein
MIFPVADLVLLMIVVNLALSGGILRANAVVLGFSLVALLLSDYANSLLSLYQSNPAGTLLSLDGSSPTC